MTTRDVNTPTLGHDRTSTIRLGFFEIVYVSSTIDEGDDDYVAEEDQRHHNRHQQQPAQQPAQPQPPPFAPWRGMLAVLVLIFFPLALILDAAYMALTNND